MTAWHDLPCEVRATILSERVKTLANLCKTNQYGWKEDGFSPAFQFNSFRSILLTCRDFYHLATTVKIENVSPYVYFQAVQYQNISTLTKFAQATWSGKKSFYYDFRRIESYLGRFLNNPLVSCDIDLVESIFTTFSIELYPRLLLGMEEFFMENAESTFETSVVTKETGIFPRGPRPPYMVHLTKGNTRIEFPRLPPLCNITAIEFDPPINPDDDDSDFEIISRIQNGFEWWLVELPKANVLSENWFLINYKARILWNPRHNIYEYGVYVADMIYDICERVAEYM